MQLKIRAPTVSSMGTSLCFCNGTHQLEHDWYRVCGQVYMSCFDWIVAHPECCCGASEPGWCVAVFLLLRGVDAWRAPAYQVLPLSSKAGKSDDGQRSNFEGEDSANEGSDCESPPCCHLCLHGRLPFCDAQSHHFERQYLSQSDQRLISQSHTNLTPISLNILNAEGRSNACRISCHRLSL